MPPDGRFLVFTDIAAERFGSSTDTSQLALEFTGSSIIRPSRDYVWNEDVLGNKVVTRQYNYTLFLLQASGTSGSRADTSGFLDDFTEWVTEMDIRRKIPAFGDDSLSERTYVDNGSHLADWAVGGASVYMVKIHKIYSKEYLNESEDY